MFLNELEPNFIVKNQQYEFESLLDENNILGWLKTIAGFANANGGTFYIGVEDKTNKILGFSKEELDKEKLFFYNQIKQHLVTLPVIISSILPYHVNSQERYILKFEIQESKIKPVFLKFNDMPMVFVRRDGYTNPATIEEIQTMVNQFKAPAFDTQITNIKYDRNDFKAFFKFFSERNQGRTPTEKELASIGFFDDNSNLIKGAYLFSDKYDGGETKVVCSLYRGLTRGDNEVITSNPFTGNLIKSFDFIWDFAQAKMNHGFIKKENYRIDIDSFPNRALFEAIINALAHRDYFLSNSQISIDIFLNRIAISSPGSLFNGGDIAITYDLNSFISRRRNKIISDIFVFSKAMEAKETGFEKIENDYSKADALHKPFVFSKNNQFTIVLPDLTYQEGVLIEEEQLLLTNEIQNTSRYDLSILSFCCGSKKTVREIAEHVKASNSTFFREKLDNLVKQGFLISFMNSKGILYTTNNEKVKTK